MPLKETATKPESVGKKRGATGRSLPKSAAKKENASAMAAKPKATAKKPQMKFFSAALDDSIG